MRSDAAPCRKWQAIYALCTREELEWEADRLTAERQRLDGGARHCVEAAAGLDLRLALVRDRLAELPGS